MAPLIACVFLVIPVRSYAQLKDTSPVFVVDLTGEAPVATVISVATFNEALAGVLPPAENLQDFGDRKGVATPAERVAGTCTSASVAAPPQISPPGAAP